jgi:hypothetical protein
LTTLEVTTGSLNEDRAKLTAALDGASANFDMLDDKPMVADVSVEGELNLVD